MSNVAGNSLIKKKKINKRDWIQHCKNWPKAEQQKKKTKCSIILKFIKTSKVKKKV